MTCDFCTAAGTPDTCEGAVSGGLDYPWACDRYAPHVEAYGATSRGAWRVVNEIAAAHRADVVDQMVDDIRDFLAGHPLDCGCTFGHLCADHRELVEP